MIESEEECFSLYGLVTLLKKFLRKDRPSIYPLEISLLNEFSDFAFFPLLICNPRLIIENMMNRHKFRKEMIYNNPTLHKILVYNYSSGQNIEKYVFSNNMSFPVDVVTICYLYGIIEICKLDIELANDLMKIMKIKYDIQNTTTDPNVITLPKILLCFPSISLGILSRNNVKLYEYPGFSWLPNIFCSPWVALIIPILNFNYRPVVPLLLAHQVMLDKTKNKLCFVLYQRVHMLLTSKIFPNRLKLKLSKKFGIVYMEGNVYQYAPYFTIARESAIDFLLITRQNDPSLRYTLSQL